MKKTIAAAMLAATLLGTPVAQAVLIPFKGLRRARITRKLIRSHFHVARLLGTLS